MHLNVYFIRTKMKKCALEDLNSGGGLTVVSVAVGVSVPCVASVGVSVG